MSDKVQGFPTTDGRIIAVRPVDIKVTLQLIRDGVRKRHLAQGKKIDAPTYSVTTAAGAVETYPHDETTLQTDEDKAAWAQYQTDRAAMEREGEMAVLKYFLLEGVICEDPPKEWLDRQAYYGVELPEGALDRKLHYLQTTILPTPRDLELALAMVLAVSATGNEEAVAAAEALFRRAMEGPTAQLDQPAAG